MIRTYYSLTKPRVLYGNVVTGVAGFLLAAGHFKQFDALLFVATIAGMTLVIASACVLNNYLDQDIDRLMERTKKRAIASGEVSGRSAVVFSAVLGIAGILTLLLGANRLVVAIGVAGFVVYVWLYGALSKRLSIHGTLVGSISGAAPILAGYCAVSGRVDTGAVLVFLILFFWQFPEFYSIAIFRRDEYRAAKIPVMPVVNSLKSTKIQILIYTILFVVATLLLTPTHFTGDSFFIIMALLGLYWIRLAIKGLKAADSDVWAHQMFHFSLITLLVLSFMLSIGSLLP